MWPIEWQRSGTARGTVYLRCVMAASDNRFAKYPQLPVLCCDDHQPEPIELT